MEISLREMKLMKESKLWKPDIDTLFECDN